MRIDYRNRVTLNRILSCYLSPPSQCFPKAAGITFGNMIQNVMHMLFDSKNFHRLRLHFKFKPLGITLNYMIYIPFMALFDF